MQLLWSKSLLQRAHGGLCVHRTRGISTDSKRRWRDNQLICPSNRCWTKNKQFNFCRNTEQMRDEEVTWWQAGYWQWGKTPDTRTPCKTGEDNKMWQAEVWLNLLRNNPPFWHSVLTCRTTKVRMLPHALVPFKLVHAPMRSHFTVISALG